MGDVPGSQRVVGDWEIQNKIGSGSFATVWKARHRDSRVEAAVKEINTENLNRKLQDSLASEITVLEETQHPNIVGLLDIIKDGKKIYIVLEYCSGGDLGHFIKRYKKVPEDTARNFMQQLAEGLKELRAHNLVHRDLKPQNLLLSTRFVAGEPFPLLKIADFGFARSLQPQTLADTLCGSPLYMAPEILQAQRYGAKADLWSVGVILFELVAGKPPFGGNNHVQLLHNINSSEARLPDAVAGRISGSCRSLLQQLLRRVPEQRLTFEDFFAHPFLHDAAPATLPRPANVVEPTPHGQQQQPVAQSEEGEAEAPLSEALERTISRWASHHGSLPAQVNQPQTPSASPSKLEALAHPPRTSPCTSEVVPGSSPAQKQLFGMSTLQRATSIKNAAGSTVSQLLSGLSPPSLSPLFGRSTPVSRPVPTASGSSSSRPQPRPLKQQIGWSSPPQGLHADEKAEPSSQRQADPQEAAASSGNLEDFFDNDFVLVSSPHLRSSSTTPQLLYPRTSSPQCSDEGSQPHTSTQPTPSHSGSLPRPPSRSALTTLLAAAGTATGTTITPAISPLSAYHPLEVRGRVAMADMAPLPRSIPAHASPLAIAVAFNRRPAATAGAPPLPRSYSTAPSPLAMALASGSNPPPFTRSYTAAPSPLAMALTSDRAPVRPSTYDDAPLLSAASLAAGGSTPPLPRSYSAMAPPLAEVVASGSSWPLNPLQPPRVNQPPASSIAPLQPRSPRPQPPARLTTATNPVLPPSRVQRLLQEGIGAITGTVDISALLPRVVAVLLERGEQFPPQSLQPLDIRQQRRLTQSDPKQQQSDVEALGQRLAAMQLLQTACGGARFRPQSPAAAAALRELADRADQGMEAAVAAAAGLPSNLKAATGFGALLQCVVALCKAGGVQEQAPAGPQRRAALVDYAAAMDVLLLMLLDAGSAGGGVRQPGKQAVEQQLLNMYGAVAARWVAAGGGTL